MTKLDLYQMICELTAKVTLLTEHIRVIEEIVFSTDEEVVFTLPPFDKNGN